MKVLQGLPILLLLAATLFALEGIPSGTTLPVTLGRTLDARKLRAGEMVIVKLAQDVPLGNSNRLRSGTKIAGRVIESQVAAGKDQGSTITLSFDRILEPTPIAIRTNLRAIASPLEVDDAKLPTTGPDRGTSSTAYTTVQVGGDVVYRGGGPVMHGDQVVGEPVWDGVLVRLSANAEGGCRGEMPDAGPYQATYVFAASACGAYGFGDLEIADSGRTNPQGQIVLKSKSAPIKLRAGTALLLRVTESAVSNKEARLP